MVVRSGSTSPSLEKIIRVLEINKIISRIDLRTREHAINASNKVISPETAHNPWKMGIIALISKSKGIKLNGRVRLALFITKVQMK